MAYEIPYDSNYSEWYGVPQNVTRLSAVLEQATYEDGNSIGRITASWDMPDNGGTFVAQVSTDGENYTIVETNIRQNNVVLTVLPNTDYYLKIVTVLDINQSSGTVSDLLSATDIPTPNAPVVTVTPSGLRIDVGIIPQGYTASISIDNGEDVSYVDTSNLVYMYLCNDGVYNVSVAFTDVNGNTGTYSSDVTVTVAELATQTYVEEYVGDYVEENVNIYNLETPIIGHYNLVDDGSAYYIATAQEIVLDNSSGPTRKSNSIPAIRGYYNSGNDWAVPLLMSLVADGVTMHRGSATSTFDTETYDGIYHDPILNLDWYYNAYWSNLNLWGSWTVGVSTPLLNNGTSMNVTQACASLLAEANPTLLPTETIEENLFYPTNFMLSSGDTISDETLKSLIAYHRPITINGTVYTPSDYTNGTYTYYALQNGTNSTEIKKAQISSAWVITITTESAGGGGGSYTAGDGIDITSDVISLETASANDIGGIKVGSGLSIDANGVLSAIGGGGGSGGYKEDILFYNASGSTGIITLSHNMSDYDLLLFYNSPLGGNGYYRSSNIYTPSYIKNLTDATPPGNNFVLNEYSSRYVKCAYVNDTTINAFENSGDSKIEEIIGIKFGGGGGNTKTTIMSGENPAKSAWATYSVTENLSSFDFIKIIAYSSVDDSMFTHYISSPVDLLRYFYDDSHFLTLGKFENCDFNLKFSDTTISLSFNGSPADTLNVYAYGLWF